MDGLHLSETGAAMFADELVGRVNSGTGSINYIFGSKQKPWGLRRGAPNRTRCHGSTYNPAIVFYACV